MGGNIDIVKWLIEAHGCPIFMKRRPHSADLQSLQTSKKRTLMDLVMNGRPKIEVLAYLVGKNLSVTDTDDPNLASKTLQTILRAENQSGGRLFGSNNCSNASVSTEEDSVGSITHCLWHVSRIIHLFLISTCLYAAVS